MPLDLQTKINIVETDPLLAYSFRGGPEPHDEFLALRIGEDYQSYTRMRRDPHVRAQLTKRVQALLGRRVIVEGKSKKTTAIAQNILDKYLSYEAICSMLKSTGDLIGFAVLRMDWEPMGGYILPRFEFVPQNRFSFAFAEPDDRSVAIADGSANLDPKTEIVLINGYELRLLTKAHPLKGERCPKGRFLVYTFEGDGSPWGLGLGYSIFPWWTVKKQAMKAWLLHSDRIGSPPVLGNKPENANTKNPEQKAADALFERFLRAISPNGWANMPYGYEAKMLEDSSSSPDVHQRLIEVSDAQISKAVLGEVAFSEKATGSYAANESQVADRESSLIDADCNLLDEQLQQQLWTEIQRLNYPDMEAATVRRETIADKRQIAAEAEAQASLKDRVDRDQTLQNMGYRVKPDAVKKVYGDEYLDTSVTEGEEQKQALISILQVGGTTALMTFLSGFSQSGLSKENAVAVLTAVFGVSAEVAESMLPEPPEPEAAAPTSVEDALGAALGTEEETPVEPEAETVDLAELLDRILSSEYEYAETDLSTFDFRGTGFESVKRGKACKPSSVSCGDSCQRAGAKCSNDSTAEGQKGLGLLDRSIQGFRDKFKVFDPNSEVAAEARTKLTETLRTEVTKALVGSALALTPLPSPVRAAAASAGAKAINSLADRLVEKFKRKEVQTSKPAKSKIALLREKAKEEGKTSLKEVAFNVAKEHALSVLDQELKEVVDQSLEIVGDKFLEQPELKEKAKGFKLRSALSKENRAKVRTAINSNLKQVFTKENLKQTSQQLGRIGLKSAVRGGVFAGLVGIAHLHPVVAGISSAAVVATMIRNK